jgi:hypothetical protein
MIGQILSNNNEICYSNFSPTFHEVNTPNTDELYPPALGARGKNQSAARGGVSSTLLHPLVTILCAGKTNKNQDQDLAKNFFFTMKEELYYMIAGYASNVANGRGSRKHTMVHKIDSILSTVHKTYVLDYHIS